MRPRASRLCAPSVRMLCRRSASLIMITRRSRDIATSILRKLSAAASWRSRNFSLSSLVTPSTSSATASPNSAASASRVSGVSSLGACRGGGVSASPAPPGPAPARAELAQHLGHRHRVGDIGLTRLARLPSVRGGSDFPGTAQQRQLFRRQVMGGAFKLEDVVGYGGSGGCGDLGSGAWVHARSLFQRDVYGKS